MIPGNIINIHSHIHTFTDVPARIKEWEASGCTRWCALADCKFWQPPYSTYLGNEGVLKWMKEFPDIIVGMGSVELGLYMGTPDDIDRLKEQGFSGLKFEMPARAYDHDCYMPYYERAQSLGMPILFHTGFVAPLPESDVIHRQSSECMRPGTLDRIARSFPNLKIIGAHLGLPYAKEALALLNFPNVYFDICGGSGAKKHRTLIKHAMAPLPDANMDDPDENLAIQYFSKMVFGTDNPPVSIWLDAAEEIMDYLNIPDMVRRAFYSENAKMIFGWDN